MRLRHHDQMRDRLLDLVGPAGGKESLAYLYANDPLANAILTRAAIEGDSREEMLERMALEMGKRHRDVMRRVREEAETRLPPLLVHMQKEG